jgi:serine/threonine protein kinase
MRPIEQAVRDQLNLLDCERSTVGQFVHTMSQLSGASTESQLLVSKTLENLRLSGGLSDRVASLVAPFVLATPDANGATVDLKPDAGLPRSPDPAAAVSISVGRVLRDRYVIQERLGAGGKGTVFRALDRYRSSLPDAQQHVALKVLHSGRDCTEQTIKDLRRELHCAQVLSHQNIVNVFELDRDGDVVFFTMELLDGELLGDLIARMHPAAMQPLQAWQIIRQLGAGLEHAHERGIVHGDLKPRNILITREGELRILDFGAAQRIVRTQSGGGQPDRAPMSGTPAYASCELLEGRTTDPRDDLYALACICYELLSGAHPFACRPATVARDFGVKATRPADLTGRQWRTLQSGLSWHRAGRSMSVHTWIQRLTHNVAENRSITPLRELKAASPAKPLLQSPAAAAFIAVLLIVGACVAQLRETSARKASDGAATRAAQDAVKTASEAAPPSKQTPPADALVALARPANAKDAVDGMAPGKPSARQPPSTISVDGYQVSSGEHFVEIRVHRNQLQKNASFTWWTEPATARQDVDYVHQAKAIQAFPSERRSTRFYVKLLPDSGRSQRDYFYVAIAPFGRDRISDKVTRVQIWLPTPRDQLQARR